MYLETSAADDFCQNIETSSQCFSIIILSFIEMFNFLSYVFKVVGLRFNLCGKRLIQTSFFQVGFLVVPEVKEDPCTCMHQICMEEMG